MAESNKMKDMPVNKLMIQMGIPMILSMALQAVYNIVDSAFVGNMRVGSEAALNALTLVFPVQMLMVAAGIGTGVGTNALLARTLGQGNREKAAKVAGNSLFLGVIIYVVCLLFGIFGVKAYISSQTVDAEVLEMGVSYLRICCVISFGIIFFSLFEKLLQATGRSLYSTIGQVVGAVVNIILDPIMIYGIGPVPEMGVKGAALATVLSQACSAVWVLTFLFSRHASLPLEKRYMALNREIILSIFALGVSPFIMASTESLVGFVLNSSLKDFGDIYVSALTILQSAMQFASVPLTGFAQGFVPIVSYNYGHGDKQRVKDCFRVALITMFSFNLLLMLFMILFPSTVASAFTSDERLIETVRWAMPVFLGGMTIFGLQRACQNMFVALGQAKISIFIALLRKAILLIPLALILPHFMGVAGVYAAEAISDATAAICCTLLFFWQLPKILGKI
mgnify:CR=1 FL=1